MFVIAVGWSKILRRGAVHPFELMAEMRFIPIMQLSCHGFAGPPHRNELKGQAASEIPDPLGRRLLEISFEETSSCLNDIGHRAAITWGWNLASLANFSQSWIRKRYLFMVPLVIHIVINDGRVVPKCPPLCQRPLMTPEKVMTMLKIRAFVGYTEASAQIFQRF